MALSIQERLKDLRVERRLTLEQLAEQTGLSKSALGSYESDDYKDISHHAINRLADFYGVTTDYLLARTETKSHPNASLADLCLSDDMIDLLKSKRIDTALLCELATHPEFVKLLADIQIYVEGIASMQIQNLNAWVDVARAEVMEKYQPDEHDKTLICYSLLMWMREIISVAGYIRIWMVSWKIYEKHMSDEVTEHQNPLLQKN